MAQTGPDAVFLEAVLFRFQSFKRMGRAALEQATDEDLNWRPDPDSNSVAVIVKHLHGNMLSRWTDFLTTDGEKPNRERDAEFESDAPIPRDTLLAWWEEGWNCLLNAISELEPRHTLATVHIRGEELGVIDATLRQLGHAAYHVGQITWILKARRGKVWKTLSIPRGKSKEYRPTRRE